MDVKFNEECADAAMKAFGHSSYRYALMTNAGVYQWRWLYPLPPSANGNPEVSPVFTSVVEAADWAKKRTTPVSCSPDNNSGWTPL